MPRRLIVIGIIIFIIAILAVFLFGFFKESNNSGFSAMDSSVIPTINTSNPENTQTFYGMDISVPENWGYETASFPGGESFVMRPKSNPPDSYFPSIIIQRYPKEEYENLQKRVVSYANSGMDTINATINGATVKGVQGKNPFKVEISDKLSDFFSTVFVYQFAGSAYYFEYKYAGAGKNTQLEGISNSIISSIKFNR